LGGFGLTIGINADPSQAQAAIGSLKTSLDQAAETSRFAATEMSDSFINAHLSPCTFSLKKPAFICSSAVSCC
jgi:hypothetical protein